MKKLLLYGGLLFGIVLHGFSQAYKPFQLYFGLGYAVPDGFVGFIRDFEPAYRISDKFAVGFRLEGASLSKCSGCDLSREQSYTINAKYYFENNSKLRPYAGIGVGFFKMGVADYLSGGPFAARTEPGLYPRFGFDSGHFNLNLDFNIIRNSVYSIDFPGIPDTVIKNDFATFRIGFFLFGGEN